MKISLLRIFVILSILSLLAVLAVGGWLTWRKNYSGKQLAEEAASGNVSNVKWLLFLGADANMGHGTDSSALVRAYIGKFIWNPGGPNYDEIIALLKNAGAQEPSRPLHSLVLAEKRFLTKQLESGISSWIGVEDVNIIIGDTGAAVSIQMAINMPLSSTMASNVIRYIRGANPRLKADKVIVLDARNPSHRFSLATVKKMDPDNTPSPQGSAKAESPPTPKAEATEDGKVSDSEKPASDEPATGK